MAELFGRTEITTDVEEIDASNVLDVLTKALSTHEKNRSDIETLYNYYKGKQDIRDKEKEIRPEINNRVCVNRANEIVTFKTGYLVGEPIQYINRSGDDSLTESINRFNEFMFAENKAAKDKILFDWLHICGVGYRMILPNEQNIEGESPFKIYTLEPMNTFVVKSSGLGNRPMLGVRYVKRTDGVTVYSCYTDTTYFEIENKDTIIATENNPLGAVPIIEYCANTARLGAFEIVIDLLNALNTTISNRLDAVEQFVRSLMKIKGANIDRETLVSLKDLGALTVPEGADVEFLVQELNQTQIQTLVDDMYMAVLKICGMPSQADGSTSDSSNNGAVILRNGWQAAEGRAKETEMMFSQGENRFLRLACAIASTYKGVTLLFSQIEPRFTRRNYENILEKSQVLTTMLNNEKIHPLLAFEHSGMFSDPDTAYAMSMEYYEQTKSEYSLDISENYESTVNSAKDGIGLVAEEMGTDE